MTQLKKLKQQFKKDCKASQMLHIYWMPNLSICKFLDDEDRGMKAFQKAFYVNPHNSYAAISLAKYLIRKGQISETVELYGKAIDASPGEKSLHYNYARLLIDTDYPNGNLIERHLRSAFTEGDKNYDAQFWYARQLYVNNKISESQGRFHFLGECPIEQPLRRKIRGIIKEQHTPVVFHGRITRMEPSYCLITRDGTSDEVFLHISNCDEAIWSQFSLKM